MVFPLKFLNFKSPEANLSKISFITSSTILFSKIKYLFLFPGLINIIRGEVSFSNSVAFMNSFCVLELIQPNLYLMPLLIFGDNQFCKFTNKSTNSLLGVSLLTKTTQTTPSTLKQTSLPDSLVISGNF